jgi:hypothetical protein
VCFVYPNSHLSTSTPHFHPYLVPLPHPSPSHSPPSHPLAHTGSSDGDDDLSSIYDGMEGSLLLEGDEKEKEAVQLEQIVSENVALIVDG